MNTGKSFYKCRLVRLQSKSGYDTSVNKTKSTLKNKPIRILFVRRSRLCL
uniref:Ribosomal protein L33 n=1 Tax=Parascaris equorum TaxID=6256 RepID=A0A914R4S3_PAREQ